MIFRPELAKLIVQGKKSMTRRPSHGETSCRYRVEHVYRVQLGRGMPGRFPITIKAVREEALGEITLKDAKREGFVTTQEFADYWKGLYGKFDEDSRVWVISFALGDATDTPRLLAARPGAPHGDYVGQSFLAMPLEPEAVSGGEQAIFTKDARLRDGARGRDPLVRERNEMARSLGRMRDILEREPNREVSKEVRAMEHRIVALDRKLKAA